MPRLANASTRTRSLLAFQLNQQRESAAIARVVLRAIAEGTLGESSPHYGNREVVVRPYEDYRIRAT